MSKLSDHTTQYGLKTTVFQMSTSHIQSCINLWSNGLKENKYNKNLKNKDNKPQFIKVKIALYNKVLQKRLYI